MKKRWIFYGFVAAVLLLRIGYYGGQYFPILDDYIQYGVYSTVPHPFSQIILHFQDYTVRPLAVLTDIYVWSNFWDHMWIAFLIITLLHGVSCVLLYEALNKAGIRCGLFFVLVYLLAPVGTEASYWISGSSRIIVPLFFASVGVWCLTKKGVGWTAAAWLFNLLSYGYYEQICIVSFLLFVMVAIRQKSKKWVIAGVNGVIIAGWYVVFASVGQMADRGGVSFGSPEQLERIGHYFYEVWAQAVPKMTLGGALRGFQLALSDQRFIFMALIVGVAIAFAVLCGGDAQDNKKFSVSGLVLSILLIFLPYLPIFVLKDAWFGLRNTFPSLLGIGLLLDNVFYRPIRLKKAAVAVMTIIFLFGTVSELYDYKRVYEDDQKILRILQEAGLPQHVLTKLQYTEVFVPVETHVLNVTSSDWALCGAVREYKKDMYYPYINVYYEEDAVPTEVAEECFDLAAAMEASE